LQWYIQIIIEKNDINNEDLKVEQWDINPFQIWESANLFLKELGYFNIATFEGLMLLLFWLAFRFVVHQYPKSLLRIK